MFWDHINHVQDVYKLVYDAETNSETLKQISYVGIKLTMDPEKRVPNCQKTCEWKRVLLK